MWRAVLALIVLLAGIQPFLLAEGLAALAGPVTLVVDAETPLPSKALESLKSEMSRLFGPSGVRLAWADRTHAALGFEAQGIVVVRLRGDCRIPDLPMLPDERGPLAWTHISDGAVLPFSEVFCEKVTRAAQLALVGGEHSRREELMGRALGRVVAHELVHILLKHKGHEAKGIFRKGLTARDLIEEFPGDEERGRIFIDKGGKPAS
ncbi:MAG: hypothetical protein KatS3mg004_3739 [Bryobacteraceae bacterium]|nr:MAG: hypothetical protein KatS3mg004_3739 [Bryobacteraceae bacterium]